MKKIHKMIKEELLSEASLPKQAFTSSNDQIPQIWVKFGRDASLGGYYKLENDNWFRSWTGPSKGYGIMFRKFKVTTGKREVHQFGGTYDKYKITFKYLPSDTEDDVPANYDSSSGWLFIKADLGVDNPKDVESFIKSNMSKYVP